MSLGFIKDRLRIKALGSRQSTWLVSVYERNPGFAPQHGGWGGKGGSLTQKHPNFRPDCNRHSIRMKKDFSLNNLKYK